MLVPSIVPAARYSASGIAWHMPGMGLSTSEEIVCGVYNAGSVAAIIIVPVLMAGAYHTGMIEGQLP